MREKMREYLLDHSSHSSRHWSWARPNPGTRNFISFFHTNGRDTVLQPLSAIPQSAHYQKAESKMKVELKPGTLRRQMGIPAVIFSHCGMILPFSNSSYVKMLVFLCEPGLYLNGTWYSDVQQVSGILFSLREIYFESINKLR